jgi:hypothetical protein
MYSNEINKNNINYLKIVLTIKIETNIYTLIMTYLFSHVIIISFRLG